MRRALPGAWSAIFPAIIPNKVAEFEDQIDSAAAEVHDELVVLNERLSASEWLAGAKVSAADLIVFPVLMQLTSRRRPGKCRCTGSGHHPAGCALPYAGRLAGADEDPTGLRDRLPATLEAPGGLARRTSKGSKCQEFSDQPKRGDRAVCARHRGGDRG